MHPRLPRPDLGGCISKAIIIWFMFPKIKMVNLISAPDLGNGLQCSLLLDP